MIGKRFIRTVSLLLVFATCLYGISLVQRRMNTMKKDHDLIISVEVTSISPVMAFTTGALGAFRGIIADVLFLRLQHLQEKDAHFEINELGHLILQLQPDMPGAITFLAWNMAYNISVKFSGYDDRWRWVQRGIELVRDEALRYNKTDPTVYHQLGWIYQHKVGHMLDDANIYYKGQLAMQMMEVLGPEDKYDWGALAAAPDDEDGLKRLLGERLLKQLILEKTDVDRKTLADAVSKLSDLLEKDGKLPQFWLDLFGKYGVLEEMQRVLRIRGNQLELIQALDHSFLFIGEHSEFYRLLYQKKFTHRKLENSYRITGDGQTYGGFPVEFKKEVEKLGLTKILDDYFRSRWLREKYKIDADAMARIVKRTGYLDIRIPETHGIYWAERGREFAPEDAALNRMVQQCLANATRWGQLWYLTKDGTAVVRPNFDAIQGYFDIYVARENYSQGDKSGAENFLKDSIVVLYTWGEVKRAQKWFTYYKGQSMPNVGKYRKMNLEAFVLDHASEDAKDRDQKQVSTMLLGIAVQRLRSEAFGDLERADRLRQVLLRIHQRYYEKVKKEDLRQRERREIPTIEQLYIAAKRALLRGAQTPDLYGRYMRVGPDLQKSQKNLLDKKDTKGKMKIQRH
ncbi:hypothetical protein BVY04_02095 [bacterium M21]|nr:hypothetical protein BVY04_02095 [bacterium M21]